MACVASNIGSYLRFPESQATRRLLKNPLNCGSNSSVSFVSQQRWNSLSSFHIGVVHLCSRLSPISRAVRSSDGNPGESVISINGNGNGSANISGENMKLLNIDPLIFFCYKFSEFQFTWNDSSLYQLHTSSPRMSVFHEV